MSDGAALFSAFITSFFIRERILPHIFSGFDRRPVPLSIQLEAGFLLGALIVILVFAFEKLYIKRFTFWEEVRHLFRGITLSFVLLMMIVFITRGYEQYSRAVLVMTWLFGLLFFPVFRLASKKLLVRLNLWKKKVFIIGTSDIGQCVALEIDNNDTLGYEIAGFLTDDRKLVGTDVGRYKVVGEISEFENLSRSSGVRDLIVALSHISQDKLFKILTQFENSAENIRIIPRLGNVFTMGVETESFGDVLSLSVARNLTKPWNKFIKCIFEFTLALILTVILLPLLIIIAISIKLSSPGPIFFAQERMGEGNKTFKCYKFRSMYMDSEIRLEKYLQKNPGALGEWKKYRKLKKNDPRVTRVGRIIRKFSLDELPQLINFFRKEMNLVGPRPYMPEEKNLMGNSYEVISRVKPGITGLWQVRGRNILSFKERLLLDEYYIRNWSLWLDIVILIKTVKVLITRQGAY